MELRKSFEDVYAVIEFSALEHWRATPRLFLVRSVFAIVKALLVCASCWLVGHAVEVLVSVWHLPERAVRLVWQECLVAAALFAGWYVLRSISGHAEQRGYRELEIFQARRDLQHFAALDLATIESAGNIGLREKHSGACRMVSGVMEAFFGLLYVVTAMIGLLIVCWGVCWPALVLLAVFVACAASIEYQRSKTSNWYDEEGKGLYERLDYIERLLTERQPAKEVRLFGLSRRLITEYSQTLRRVLEAYVSPKRRLVCTCLQIVKVSASFVFLAWAIQQVLAGALSLGELATAAAALWVVDSWDLTYYVLVHIVVKSAPGLRDYKEFLAIEPTIERVSTATALPALPALPADLGEGIRFDNVSLTYPFAEQPSLEDVSLTIKPGERIALVGENGSGKTTFIKLLTRLYDPTAGRILVAGGELRSWDLESYRRRFGVIFQDYIRYHGTIDENVLYSQIERGDDRAACAVALEQAGASSFIGDLAEGSKTKVGCWYDKGTDLSDGQWQKIALARAFFRQADVLVLDEPTSSLDARAEYNLFSRFTDLTKGKTTILVSHRFSTVRMADTIYVFQQGRIVEHGSHDELLTLSGLYAELFTMQAEGYRDCSARAA